MKQSYLLCLVSLSATLTGCTSQKPQSLQQPQPPPLSPATLRPALAPAVISPQKATFPQKWTIDQVVKAFKSAGLEAETPSEMGHQDYGPAPMTAAEGKRFFIPSLGKDNGGRIFTFSSQADLDTLKSWYVKLGKASGWAYSYVYSRDNILVQISGDLPDAKAKKYQAALQQMK